MGNTLRDVLVTVDGSLIQPDPALMQVTTGILQATAWHHTRLAKIASARGRHQRAEHARREEQAKT